MTKTWLPALTLLAACGDNLALPDARSGADGSVDAAPTRTHAVVVAGDYTPGNPGVLAVLDVAARTITANAGPAMAVGEDPVLRYEAGELLIVNRGAGNNITILDAGTLALVDQLGTGASSNPQDVAVVGDRLIVPAFGTKGAVVLTRGSATVTELDLSADDPDGKPNCNSIYKVGDRLFVSCELLDDTMQFLPPRGPGKIYVLDATTLAITSTVTLTTVNPFGLLEQVPTYAPNAGDLIIPTIDFGTGQGCVERITTGATPGSAGCLVGNATLGNFASRIGIHAVEFTGPVTGIVVPPYLYAAVPDAADYTKAALRSYDLLNETLLEQQTVASQAIGDLVVCPTGELVVSDTTIGTAGLRVYDGLVERSTGPLDPGLRPLSSHGLVCF